MKARSSVRVERVALNGATVALDIVAGRIARIDPVPGPADWQALPLPVDPHLHLDKTFLWPRARPAAPGLFPAIEANLADRAHWTPDDIRTRAGRALAEAAGAGMGGLRSHVDWVEPGVPLAWDVLAEMAVDAPLTVQRAPLVSIDLLGDADQGPPIAAHVARTGDGVLGAFLYRHADYPAKLARIFRLAADHGLHLDFHVDEGLEVEAQGLDEIIRLTAAHGMAGRVLCGHACSLSVRPADQVARVLDAMAAAGVALCVLPATNLWIQDSAPGRTPRLRGLAPLHEARAAGVSVMFGADNVSDPFYPFGCYDPLETLRLACTAAHLDPAQWLEAITTAPARALGLTTPAIVPGAPADLLLVRGADWHDALRGPARRRILRQGVETPSHESVPA
jgi:cytosine/creatinine deaminase